MTEPSKFVFTNDGERPLIREYRTKAKFFVNDRVTIRNAGVHVVGGPFIIDSIVSGQYKLRDKGRNLVEEGRLFKEDDLEEYDPFA